MACYQAALEVFRPEDFPEDHRRTSGNMASAREALEALEQGLAESRDEGPDKRPPSGRL